MSGGHRKKTSAWKLQAAVASGTALTIVTGVWIVNGHPEPAQQAALVVTAPRTAPTAAANIAAPPPPVAIAAPVVDPDPVKLMGKIPVPCSTELSGTQPHVAMVGNFLKAMFQVNNVGGRDGRAGSGDDHGMGLALDFMVPNAEVGTMLADYVLANRTALGVTYVIWQQRYNDGGGWSGMEDRGSPTANHMDHVHLSFAPSAVVNLTC
ncbi:hypothetical protein [Antrihabitans stalactiti]|uniref:ARB-07466-like C-terminal domain-containing protein n=1 Tax=Antrihabitans stalactiti TaxID=2584121 RepID=A0A848K701_9NOCA|nr:hypothetical protein [Antrihabitans stalactiti]